MWAAAISPWEWPIRASGRTPHSSQSFAKETITAKRAGWAIVEALEPGLRPLLSKDLCQGPLHMGGECFCSASRMGAAKAGEESSRPLAIPDAWEP